MEEYLWLEKKFENTPSMVATDDYFNHDFVILKFL